MMGVVVATTICVLRKRIWGLLKPILVGAFDWATNRAKDSSDVKLKSASEDDKPPRTGGSTL